MKRSILPLALVLLVLAACIYTYRLEVTDNRAWTATGLTALDLSTRNGSVEIDAAGSDSVHVEITKSCYGRNKEDAEKYIGNIAITDTVIAGRLDVTADMPTDGRNYGAAFDVACPGSLDLDVRTSNGSVTVTSMTGDVVVETSNGSVTLTGTNGAADINTSNGAVDLRVHQGAVTVNTSNGSVDCDVAALGPAEQVDLETSNGAVTLLLPADVSCTFDASTSNGEVTVVASGFGSVNYTLSERTHKAGTIGSGASTVNIETSNASVTIRAR